MVTSIVLFFCQTLHVISNVIYNISYDQSYSSLVFNSAILLWTGFVVYLCFDCILSENEFQLFAVLFTSSFMTLASVTNGFFKSLEIIRSWVDQTHNDATASIFIEVVVIISTLGVILCSLFLTILFRSVYKSFGWRMFKYAGGNKKSVRYFKMFLAFKTILKMDLSLNLVMWYLSIMFIPRGEGGKEPWELALIYTTLAIGLLISLVTYPLLTVSSRFESYILHIIVIVANFLLPIFYVINYVVALIHLPSISLDGFGNPFYLDCNVKDDRCLYGIDQNFTYVIVGIATFVTLFFQFVTFSIATLLMFNWGKGFKYTLRKQRDPTTALYSMNDFEKIFARGRKELKERARRKKRSKSTSIPEAQDIEDDDSFFDEEEDDNDSLFNDVDL
eukprot:CAMPEP_0117442664 /NCGR_PEP_ID=MMETSP0759-20121206/4274_1 /TAXON_ID=63605 /ORGANISM="Percolomonas cosmopolitus, Strain WS" /LENGTH=389 /DNA_ID=CAMNT_0005234571 /DNA_START=415 /DNA_END=1584 /DNA_ORIENTATION=+